MDCNVPRVLHDSASLWYSSFYVITATTIFTPTIILGSICSKLTERHIPSLLQQLKNHAVKWREIGIHLGFLPGELSNIEARPTLTPGAPISWLGAMLEEWIQWAPGDGRGSTSFANVEDLKAALTEARLAVTALDLKL
jgi:hypothetical protein